jgi:tetratricopeptide (TPR) repeat protein
MLNFFRKLLGLGGGAAAAPAATPTAAGAPDQPRPPMVGGPETDAPIVIVPGRGATMIMDRLAYEYQYGLARGGDPSQAELDALLARADRLRVLAGGLWRDAAIGVEVLHDARGRAAMAELRRCLRIVEDPQSFGHCMCLGGPTIELYAGGRVIAALGLHHGRSFRWDRWKHDAALADPSALRAWLTERGVEADPRTGPEDPMGVGLLGVPPAERHAMRGDSHRRRGEPQAAREECDRALAIDPSCATACATRGLIHRDAGRYEEAVADLTAAIAGGVEHPELYHARAMALDMLDRPEPALADCDTALRLAPDHPGVRNSRGFILAQLGRNDEARAELDAAVRLSPETPQPYGNRARLHLQLGEIDEALEDLSEAIRLFGQEAEGPGAVPGARQGQAMYYLVRAEVHARRGDDEGAQADYARALECDPDSPNGLLARAGYWLRNGESHLAIVDCDEAIRLRPDRPEGYNARGQARRVAEEPEGALEDFTAAIRWQPDDPVAYLLRAETLLSLGRADEALADCDRAARIAPENPGVAMLASRCHRARGDLRRQREALEAALRLAPEDLMILNSLAWLLATCPDDAVRDGPRAVELAAKAVAGAGDHPEPIDTLAAALAECGRFDEARRREREAIDKSEDPGAATSYRWRLELYEENRPYREPA